MSEERSKEEYNPGKNLRILVVEDHSDTLQALSRLLSHFGHDISTADGAQSALEIINSKEFDGLTSAEARGRIAEQLQRAGKGQSTITWRQRDWGFSRQRYWGTPIPILYCEKCDPQRAGIPVPEKDLPVVLPEIDVQEVLTGKGEPPLAKVASALNPLNLFS